MTQDQTFFALSSDAVSGTAMIKTQNIGMPLKRKLRVKGLTIMHRWPSVGSIGLELACFFRVAKVCLEILVPKEPPHLFVGNRRQNFDATVEISRHPVGTAEEDLTVAAVL